jgi:hypothetical protein
MGRETRRSVEPTYTAAAMPCSLPALYSAILTTRRLTQHFTIVFIDSDRLCGLVVRVPGYRKEMNCVSSDVRTEFIYVM